jgi:hydrogenase nickel incorporation protein HypA/HybF
MHELSIASALADIVLRHADGRRVTAVEVRVGRLRQVVPDALEFAFELVARETPLEGARLELQDVPVTVRCRGCDAESGVDGFPFACAACGDLDVEVTAGDELSVEAIEVEDMALSGGR